MKEIIKHKYVYVGRRVFKMYPEIAEKILNHHHTRPEAILHDYEDIEILLNVFREYFGDNFPENLSTIPQEKSTYIKIKFTALCLICFDPQTVGPVNKKIKDHLRECIAKSINVNPSSISQYLKKIKVYMRAYEDFGNDIGHLLSITRLKIGNNNDNVTN
jgi:hypothetical protein